MNRHRIDHRDHHPDRRDGERRMEAEPRLHDGRDHRRQERADVDAHVEDVVGAILEVAALGIEVADHRRDVRLEEPVADHQAGQRGVDERQRPDRQQQVAGHEEEAADHHGAPVAELPVGDPPADQRADVHEHQVVGVERRGLRGRPPEPLDGIAQVEREHRHHRVEAEALPHLGGEQDVQPLRVLFRFRLGLEKGGGNSGGHWLWL